MRVDKTSASAIPRIYNDEITRDNTTGTLTCIRYYAHNGTPVALRVGGANISWLQADQHGTPRSPSKLKPSTTTR